MAHPIFLGRGLLEPGGCRSVRVLDQSAHGTILHTGTQHHASACPCRLVRRIRPAGPGIDAVGSEKTLPPGRLARRSPADGVLVYEWRPWP